MVTTAAASDCCWQLASVACWEKPRAASAEPGFSKHDVAPRWMRAGWAEAWWVGKIPKELRRMNSFPPALAVQAWQWPARVD